MSKQTTPKTASTTSPIFFSDELTCGSIDADYPGFYNEDGSEGPEFDEVAALLNFTSISEVVGVEVAWYVWKSAICVCLRSKLSPLFSF
jgi:hypothetical protein